MYCGDKGTIDGLIISLLSIVKYIKKPLNVYLLTMKFDSHEPLNKKQARVLENILYKGNKESKIHLIDATKYYESCTPTANIDTRFTPYCMLRLYADMIKDIPERILYLDYDVVCNQDFSDFYNLDIKNYELAGVLDYYGSHFFKKKVYTKDYLNSGVLLLNMANIKKSGLFAKARVMCKEKLMLMPDQSALNKLCEKKLIMPRKYNEQHKMQKDTVFRHFTTTFKFFPWVRTQTIKPWHIDKVHNVLKTYDFDDIFDEYLTIKGDMTNE